MHHLFIDYLELANKRGHNEKKNLISSKKMTNEDQQKKSEKTRHEGHVRNPAPDGGYGWVVLTASFVSQN